VQVAECEPHADEEGRVAFVDHQRSAWRRRQALHEDGRCARTMAPVLRLLGSIREFTEEVCK
jgi:hypothetical protein